MPRRSVILVVLLSCAVSAFTTQTSAQTRERTKAKTVVAVDVFREKPRQLAIFARGPKDWIMAIPAQKEVTLQGEHVIIKTLGSEARWELIKYRTPGGAVIEGWVNAGEVNGTQTLNTGDLP